MSRCFFAMSIFIYTFIVVSPSGIYLEISMNSSLLDELINATEEKLSHTEEDFLFEYCECGEENTLLSSRIVGGKAVGTPGKYPWMVAIAERIGLSKTDIFCGGVLISSKYVLTAAHCLYDKTASKLFLVIGTQNLSTLLSTVSVSKFILHPDYKRKEIENDIALVKLKNSTEFNDFIRPICLPHRKDFPLPDEAVIAGWGKMRKKGLTLHEAKIFLVAKIMFKVRPKNPKSKNLREVKLPIIPNTDCQLKYDGLYNITDSMICAGKFGKDACQGDSGGPLFAEYEDRWYDIGIVSFGLGCGSGAFPGVYTRVSHYLEWIRNNTRSAPPCNP